MTTEHLDIPEDDLDKILGGLGKSAKQDNDNDLMKDFVGIDAQIENIVLGASVLVQRKLDRQDELKDEVDERRRQRELINQRAARLRSSVTVEPTPEPEDEEEDLIPRFISRPTTPVPVVDEPEEDDILEGLYTRDELMEFSNEDLQRLANEYGIIIVVTDASRVNVIALIIIQQSAYCECEDIEDPNGTPNRPTLVVRIRDSRHNPRSWNGWQWVCAIIGALIGIVVYRVTNDWEQDITGTWNRVFDVLLFVSLVGLGFFFGAIIGAAVEDRQENLRSRS